jgi:hypothetical protein
MTSLYFVLTLVTNGFVNCKKAPSKEIKARCLNYSHIKSHPFGARSKVAANSSMVQVCVGFHLTGNDTMAYGKEGIRPLLENALSRCKDMWGRRREVKIPMVLIVA